MSDKEDDKDPSGVAATLRSVAAQERLREARAKRAARKLRRLEPKAKIRLAPTKAVIMSARSQKPKPVPRSTSRRIAAERSRTMQQTLGMIVAKATSRSALPTRTMSADGRTTFHFSMRAVSKGDEIIPGTPAAHQKYLERSGAVDTFGADHNNIKIETGLSLGAAQQAYIERHGATEMLDRKLSWGNIGETIDDRAATWKAIEKQERLPSPGFFFIRLKNTEERTLFQSLQTRDDAPALIRNCEFKKTGVKTQAKDNEIAEAATWLAANAPTLKPVHETGRGGRIQYRVIIELPHQITTAQRVAAMNEITTWFAERDLPHHMVLHKPEDHNDWRNYHAHFVFYDRPARRLPNGNWDFAETRLDAKGRTTYPYRQKKIREINAKEFPLKLKAMTATAINRQLAASGLPFRYSEKSYAELGIEKTPTKHIGTNASGLERKGIVTTRASSPIQIEYDEDLAAIDHARRQRLIRAQRTIDLLELGDLALVPQHTRHLVTQYLNSETTIADHARDQARLQHKRSLMLSRPQLQLHMTRKKIDEISERLDKGTARNPDRAKKRLDLERKREANTLLIIAAAERQISEEALRLLNMQMNTRRARALAQASLKELSMIANKPVMAPTMETPATERQPSGRHRRSRIAGEGKYPMGLGDAPRSKGR